MQQLDIFIDSADQALRNDLAEALLRGDVAAAERAAQALQDDFGGDSVLAPAATLLARLRWQQAQPEAGRLAVTELRAAAQQLLATVEPAAQAVLPQAGCGGWMAAQWRWLAQRAEGLDFSADVADVHAAALHLRARAWPQAAEAVARIASWRRIPQPLLWMAQARWQGEGPDAGWPLLAEALWLSPRPAAALLRALAREPRRGQAGTGDLQRLLRAFEAALEPDAEPDSDPNAEGQVGADHPWAWLPAFALIEQPLLAEPLQTAVAHTAGAPEAAFRTVLALLRLERQGRHAEVMAQRARLKALSEPLLAAYLRTR